MFEKKIILLMSLLFLMSLTVVNAVNFDIPSGYQQISSSASRTELENNAGDYIIITDGDYISYEDLILKLGNDYVISGIQNLKINGVDVKEYRLSSEIQQNLFTRLNIGVIHII